MMNWKNYFIFTASEDSSYGSSKSVSFYIVFATLAAVLSIFRQIGRISLRYYYYDYSDNYSTIDPTELMITGLLTFTFYVLVLRFTLQFAERNESEEESNDVLFRLGLVAQLAVLRDGLYLIWFLLHYIQHNGTFVRTDMSEIIFWHLEVLVWFFTVLFLYPQFIQRLKSSISGSDGQIIVAFIISLVAFFLSYLFNYVILRLIIALPLGRNF